MKLYYDFHLHSCLSPCGDNEMTPYNLVNMAKVLGFDVIALTDHNSCKNCRAAVRAGEDAGLTVIPGMELCTAEEIHVVCDEDGNPVPEASVPAVEICSEISQAGMSCSASVTL